VLAQKAFEAFRDLSSRFDVIVAEGAGSPAEINLRAGDYVNMGLARAVDLPVVVVGDIDRGGVLAAMYGTLALLDEADQAHIRGWIVNKFRGDLALLEPGLRMLEQRTSRPVLGTIPFLDDVWLDGEDSLAISGWSGANSGRRPTEAASGATLSVAVVRFPRLSNATDIDALAAEPGVDVRVTAEPDVVARADLVVLPGTRATMADLEWMRRRGLSGAVLGRVANARPVLGICGGYQMLAEVIDDPGGVESSPAQTVAGLGLLPIRVQFEAVKRLGRPRGHWRGNAVTAYQIHHGVASRTSDGSGTPDSPDVEPFLDGWSSGSVWGTTWHGALENDDFRRAFLTEVAAQAGMKWKADPSALGFAARRELMLDRLADAVEENLDTAALAEIIGIDL
jgi:adenosylcobyric acid synthase